MQQAQQGRVPGALRERAQRGGFLGGEVDRGRIRAQREMEPIAAVAEELREGAAWIPAVLFDLRDDTAGGGAIAVHERLEQSLEERRVEAAQESLRVAVGDGAIAERGELVEERHRVAHAAFAGAGDRAAAPHRSR